MTLEETLADRVENASTVKDLMIPHKSSFILIMNTLESLYSDDEIIDYFQRFADKEFTRKRIKASNHRFYYEMFDRPMGALHGKRKHYHEVITNVINDTIKKQKKVFVAGNAREMDLNKDVWTLFLANTLSFRCRNIDFSNIESVSLRKEAKMYLKDKLTLEKRLNLSFDLVRVTKAFNFLSSKCNVEYLRDVKASHVTHLLNAMQNGVITTDHGGNYSIGSSAVIIKECSNIVNFLITQEKYPFRPHLNEFYNIKFHNTANMCNNKTKIIPDEVSKQLDQHYHKLKDENHRLVYEILAVTGLRFCDVQHLEKDCLKPCKENDDYMMLIYTPNKTVNRRKKKGYDLKLEASIPLSLANKIERQIEKTEYIRQATGEPYILYNNLNKKHGERFQKINGSHVRAINELIKDNEICDVNGELWKYSSRQSRKTLTVKLIEQGFPIQQVAMQLGHSHTGTTAKYYAEVRQMKLADLNHEFYKERFKMDIGEERLKAYSEEERRQLYVDFAMNYREVEFGQCSKHMSEGACGVRTGKVNCATCPKLCTGIKYIDKWNELFDSQQHIVIELLNAYEKEEVPEDVYCDFIEYKKEMHLLKTYEVVLNKIKETMAEAS